MGRLKTWLLEHSPRYGRLAVGLAVAGAPVVMLPASLDLFNLTKLTLIYLAALAGGWFWFAWSVERGRWLPRFNLGYAALAFVAAYVLATAFSQNRAISVLGIYHRYGGLAPIITYAAIMILIVGLYWERPGTLRALTAAVAAGSVPVSAYALVQAAGLDWVAWSTLSGSRPELPGSTLGNSNFLGGYLGIAIPFLAYLVATAGAWKLRALLGVALTAATGALWFSGSRGGLMAAGGGLLCIAFLYRDSLGPRIRGAVAVLAATGLALAIVLVWHPGMERPPGPLREVNVLRTDTLRLRSFYWTAAWRIFLDNPLAGTGPDTYKENYETYRPVLNAADLASGTADKPHNIFLEYASNSGVLGLGTFLVLFGLALKYAGRQAQSETGARKALLAAYVGGLAAYLIQGFFSMDLPPLALLGWVCVGAIAVLADPRLVAARSARQAKQGKKRSRKERPQGNPAGKGVASALSPGRRRTLQFGAGGAILALMAWGLRPLAADITAKSGFAGTAPYPQALARFRRADKLFPLNSTYQTMAVTRVARQVRRSPRRVQPDVFAQGHSWLIRDGRQNGKDLFSAINLARVNELWGGAHDASRFPVADAWWRQAIHLDPSWRMQLRYGSFLGDWALKSEDEEVKRRAVSVLQRLAEVAPDQPEVWFALGKSYILTRQTSKARIAMSAALRIRPSYASARIWRERLGPEPGKPFES